MSTLPKTDVSLLVRTDFTDDGAWEQLRNEAQAVNEDGFRAYIEPVSDQGFEGADWQAVKAAVRTNEDGASVLFIADSFAFTAREHAILVVSLDDTDEPPFRVIPSELWGIDNNLNISNMDWREFADAVDEDGIFRGFDD